MNEKLMQDLKQAMKDKDVIRKNIIQLIRAGMVNTAKDMRKEPSDLTEAQVLDVITRELKQQKDSLDAFVEGGREDLAQETREKIEIIMTYLPTQLTGFQIIDLINETFTEIGITNPTIKDRGKLMAALMPKVKGKADGKLVSEVVTLVLNG